MVRLGKLRRDWVRYAPVCPALVSTGMAGSSGARFGAGRKAGMVGLAELRRALVGYAEAG